MDGIKSGFFINLFQNTRNNLKSADIQTFSSFDNNGDCIKFVNELCKMEEKLGLERHDREQKHRTDDSEIYFYKDLNCAMEMKKIGNKFFQSQKWTEALNLYNKSYIMIPSECPNDVAILLANRSAVLYHMEHYDVALKEIERAINAGYPKEMMYKLKERKARCLLAKKNHKEAMYAFQEDIKALDDSKIPLENRMKLERDAQIMIKMLQKTLVTEEKAAMALKGAKKQEREDVAIKNKQVEHFVSDSLTFDFNELEGRFAKAGKDIKLGTYLVQEKPYASCLLQKYCQTHCQLCFKRTDVPLACSNCADVIFCSEKCRDEALNSFHKFECGIMQHLWSSGSSITCQMALRAISQKSLQYFLSLRDELKALRRETVDYSKTDTLLADDYRRIFVLVTHEKDRSFEDKFHRIMMACFLTYCIKLGGFFKIDCEGGSGGDENFDYVGALMYHNLQVMQFNAHEISELQLKDKTDVGNSAFIGGGIYPTVAFFNHSCDPGVVRYFNGNVIQLRAIKPIAEGQAIAENYGPIFTQMPKEERQQQLLRQYHFNCMCTPCTENWPTFKEMDDSHLRFRCDGLNRSCKNVLRVPLDVNDFMMKCTECGEHTNIMKGLKSLQDTDMLFKTATRLHETGDSKSALTKYVETLDILDQSLVPPFRTYHLTQQGIKRCITEFGNKVYI